MSQGTGQSMAIATASRRKGRSPTSEGQSPDKCMAKRTACAPSCERVALGFISYFSYVKFTETLLKHLNFRIT